MASPSDSQPGRDRIPPPEETKKILAAAEVRDGEAAIRDVAADRRSEAADLEAFLDVDADYAGHAERRASALDRAHSKGDREKSADDRTQLTEGGGDE